MSEPVPASNWARNVTFRAKARHRPGSVRELADIVAHSNRLRALGTGHSFNRIADTEGELVSVAGLPRVMRIGPGGSCVTVSAGVTYGALAAFLHSAGLALPNLASLPHISVAGACATGTHGSGVRNGALATAVAALEFVDASGALARLTRDGDGERFAGAVVALGRLGVVTSMTLDVLPSFDVAQYVYEGLSLEDAVAHLNEILGCAYSVSLFTDWSDPKLRVWVKARVDGSARADLPVAFGAKLADGPRNPVPFLAADNCTVQGGVPGPWHQRLPHFRPEFTPSFGEELQSEFFVPSADGAAALAALARVREVISPVLLTCEVRAVAADELWLSPAYHRDSVAFHFTWLQDHAAVTPAVAAVERQLAPFGPRPHWGKVFSIEPPDVRAQYERLPQFRSLMNDHDPAGTFGNDFVDRYLGTP